MIPWGIFTEDTHFAELTKVIRTIADQYADGRVYSVLEGGYNLKDWPLHVFSSSGTCSLRIIQEYRWDASWLPRSNCFISKSTLG